MESDIRYAIYLFKLEGTTENVGKNLCFGQKSTR